MTGIMIPDPKGGLVWIHGRDGSGNPVKVKVDTDGHLQVDVLTMALPTTPVIYNVTMILADTEYSKALPANARRFLIKCRTLYDIKLCFTSGQSGTTYLTVPAGMSYEGLIQPASLTVYFQCATADQVAEIIVWS